VSAFNGEPEGKESQQTRWVEVSALEASEFPAANVAIIDALHKKYSK
jgi:8-oxo-dGTP diphosphatase